MKSPQLARTLAVSLLSLATLVGSASSRAQDVMGSTGIRGAGSTFVYPLISKWSRDYRIAQARGGEFAIGGSGLDDPPASTALDYEPSGSLAGTLRVKAGAVDFGASDVPLTSAELAKFNLAQFPIVIGGIVAAVNIDGVAAAQLKVTGPLLADIFLGKIARWSDPAIVALNPTLKLPDSPIAVVHRSDGSGTTFNFTDYLAKVSPEWRERVGSNLLVTWPTGLAAKGNEGVARAIKRTKNSIGYVDFGQASQAGLSVALLQNRAGKFVPPSVATFQAAAAGADWNQASSFYMLLNDVPGNDAYPMVATVFVLLPKTATARSRAVLDLFGWSLDHGASGAAELGYVPLPASLVRQIRSYWARNIGAE